METKSIPTVRGVIAGYVGSYANDAEPNPINAEPDTEAPKSIRENFNETAFFEPQIHVSADGKYNWNFILPDALTRWKLMAFAHTADFKTVYHEQAFVARKELLIETFEPRILPQTLDIEMRQDDGGGSTVISFDIRGELWAEPVPVDLYLRTALDVTSGEITLTRQG